MHCDQFYELLPLYLLCLLNAKLTPFYQMSHRPVCIPLIIDYGKSY